MIPRGLVPGARVGPYQLGFKLGEGGMGQVWAAQRGGVGGSGKLVALKLLRTETLDDKLVTLFLDEARALQALHHPHIVSTYEVGQSGELCFMAMELIRGPAISAFMQRLRVSGLSFQPRVLAAIGERV